MNDKMRSRRVRAQRRSEQQIGVVRVVLPMERLRRRSDYAKEATRSRWASRVFLALLFACSAWLLVMLSGGDPWLRSVTPFLAVLLGGLMVLSVVQATGAPREGEVRVSLRGEGTWIGTRSRVYAVLNTLILANCAALGGTSLLCIVNELVSTEEDSAEIHRLAWVSLVFIPWSICLVPVFVRSWKNPPGVELTSHGVNWNTARSWKLHSVDWAEIETVGATVRKQKVSLVCRLATGAVLEINQHGLRSDPNVVAAIIRFYLEHPEYRDALNDPEEALRQFRGAVL